MNSSASRIRMRSVQWFAAVGLLAMSTVVAAQAVQEHVHSHGHEVMLFDLASTVHVFRMTEDGGTQKVILRGDSADAEQVRRIQHHLAQEAAAFRKGDFGDPAHLHGDSMPGLKDMQAGAAHMQITYRSLSNGAEIRFRTRDLKLVTAVHRWFGAQLSEHGSDARAE
ncbi:aspartate carbamoyltransferase [Ramlibacter sp. MMS24-I3-19]|uniref:aspartate carbamoyltransferase n=1 Tax=Ramlibacter sp. MMS24-I3-19 TaxID=3416606 RepID=UPI003CFC985C